MSLYKQHVFLCTNQKAPGKTCCANTGGEPYFEYLKNKLLTLGLHGPGKIRVSKSGCLGRCSEGPCIVIYPEGIWYRYSSFADIDAIVQEHLMNNHCVNDLLIETN